MSFKTLSPEARLCFIQNSLTGMTDIAAGTTAVAETIEELINARPDSASDHLPLVNHDGVIGGLATAARLLNEQQFSLLCEIGQLIEEGQK